MPVVGLPVVGPDVGLGTAVGAPGAEPPAGGCSALDDLSVGSGSSRASGSTGADVAAGGSAAAPGGADWDAPAGPVNSPVAAIASTATTREVDDPDRSPEARVLRIPVRPFPAPRPRPVCIGAPQGQVSHRLPRPHTPDVGRHARIGGAVSAQGVIGARPTGELGSAQGNHCRGLSVETLGPVRATCALLRQAIE